MLRQLHLICITFSLCVAGLAASNESNLTNAEKQVLEGLKSLAWGKTLLAQEETSYLEANPETDKEELPLRAEEALVGKLVSAQEDDSLVWKPAGFAEYLKDLDKDKLSALWDSYTKDREKITNEKKAQLEAGGTQVLESAGHAIEVAKLLKEKPEEFDPVEGYDKPGTKNFRRAVYDELAKPGSTLSSNQDTDGDKAGAHGDTSKAGRLAEPEDAGRAWSEAGEGNSVQAREALRDLNNDNVSDPARHAAAKKLVGFGKDAVKAALADPKQFGLNEKGKELLEAVAKAHWEKDRKKLRAVAQGKDGLERDAAVEEIKEDLENAAKDEQTVDSYVVRDFPHGIKPEQLLDYGDRIAGTDKDRAAKALADALGTLNGKALGKLLTNNRTPAKDDKAAQSYASRVHCGAQIANAIRTDEKIEKLDQVKGLSKECKDKEFNEKLFAEYFKKDRRNQKFHNWLDSAHNPKNVDAARKWMLDPAKGGFTREALFGYLGQRMATAKDPTVSKEKQQAAYEDALALANVLGDRDAEGNLVFNLKKKDATLVAHRDFSVSLGKDPKEIFASLEQLDKRQAIPPQMFNKTTGRNDDLSTPFYADRSGLESFGGYNRPQPATKPSKHSYFVGEDGWVIQPPNKEGKIEVDPSKRRKTSAQFTDPDPEKAPELPKEVQQQPSNQDADQPATNQDVTKLPNEVQAVVSRWCAGCHSTNPDSPPGAQPLTVQNFRNLANSKNPKGSFSRDDLLRTLEGKGPEMAVFVNRVLKKQQAPTADVDTLVKFIQGL